MRCKPLLAVVSIPLLVVLVALPAGAFPRYSSGCHTCHGDFTGSASPRGTRFPLDSKHVLHTAPGYMHTECNLCHTASDFFNPTLGSSEGTEHNEGLGCMGCHGRREDAGHDSVSMGLGAGLRQHHFAHGVSCLSCHADSDPGSYTPVGDEVLPAYYGTPDTDADPPCKPGGARPEADPTPEPEPDRGARPTR